MKEEEEKYQRQIVEKKESVDEAIKAALDSWDAIWMIEVVEVLEEPQKVVGFIGNNTGS